GEDGSGVPVVLGGDDDAAAGVGGDGALAGEGGVGEVFVPDVDAVVDVEAVGVDEGEELVDVLAREALGEPGGEAVDGEGDDLVGEVAGEVVGAEGDGDGRAERGGGGAEVERVAGAVEGGRRRAGDVF